MNSESTEQETIKTNRKQPARGNFSQCGRLLDQTLYIENTYPKKIAPKIEVQSQKRSPPRLSTSGFTSVSRQKRGNFRNSIICCSGQFTHHPDHLYGRSKSPLWSFPKKQRYGTTKISEFEICHKHPLAKKETKLYNSTSSIREAQPNVKLNKSSSMNETMEQTRNYSIVLPRKTSAIDFFSKTKIKNPFYLSRLEIMNGEEQLEQNKKIEPCPKGYIQFYKKAPHKPNKNSKNFETFLESYSHEKQYNNFSMSSYPKNPHYHIDFSKHIPRQPLINSTAGPNLMRINIDSARKNQSNIDLNIKKFRKSIRTRFDRAEPEPFTRLDYDPPQKSMPGMLTMDRTISRHTNLFPTVDPIIKKAGDEEMRAALKQEIAIKEINEAMRPKCVNKLEV